MRALRRLVGLEDRGANDARDTATVRRIARELDALPPAEARFLAAFAYVLARVARADLEISREETEQMLKLVREYSTLSEAQALLVVQMAKTQATALAGTENYLVTRQFKEMSNRAQRIDLLRCLFAVAAADNNISVVENNEITQIGEELGFDSREIAAVRAAYRDQLSVLKDVPE
ncbi:MAG TPA: TerB family tellurite resistance protein [Myxococcota bacterium]|nr:TerB family tellurite resistance protein [Myxococcota bacterium]